MGRIIVPDTSIIIDGKLSEMVRDGKLDGCEIVVPLAVLDELQAQASKNREEGFLGLNELKKLRGLCEGKGMGIRFSGDRPSLEDIRLARSGRIDAIIRDVARRDGGVLLTADYVQALVGEAEGVKVEYQHPPAIVEALSFEKFFTPDTLSVHLKEGNPPRAKVGRPGEFVLRTLGDAPMDTNELQEMAKEIVESARVRKDGFVEISRASAEVIQLGNYRIAITRPPFSDDLEITIVRPLVKLTLEDYEFSDKLIKRLKEKAEGVLIAGPPGSGKSTLASSLADFYASLGKIVKTFESPRDLQVKPEITQYSRLEGDFEKTAEILLLVRPDYTIFDEVRGTKDFQVFADMRLAGVGMVGVVHASRPVDAVQRFMVRLELGMIPSIIDTIIFVAKGRVEEVLYLELVVKVPTGMTEADLARPVVEVRDFEAGKLEYEIYTYGEENVIIPVEGILIQSQAAKKLAEDRIRQIVRDFDPRAQVEIVSPSRAVVRVERYAIPKLIGRGGTMISEIEEILGMKISVEPKLPAFSEEVKYSFKEAGNSLILEFGRPLAGKKVTIFSDGKHILTAVVSKSGIVKLGKSSQEGKEIMTTKMAGKEVLATVED